MAAGRRREEWEQTLAIVQALSLKPIDVEALNPVKKLQVQKVSEPEAEKAESKEAWANLRAGFKAWVAHGRRRSR